MISDKKGTELPYRYLFPFEYIKKGSNVLLYGFGKMGKSYLRQINSTKYCTIVGVSDQSIIDSEKYIYPQDINGLEIDYVVISIDQYTMACQAYSYLIDLGVERKLMIHHSYRNDKTLEYVGNSFAEKKLLVNRNKTNIGLVLQGGLGDYIVHESLFERICHICPESEFYIFGEEEYAQTVFLNKKNVKGILNNDDTGLTYDLDLVLKLRLCITVVRKDDERLSKLAPQLLNMINGIDTSYSFLEGSEGAMKDLILIRRAEIKELNRFGLLGQGSLFELDEKLISINTDEKYDCIQVKENYITINYGSNQKYIQSDDLQTKVYPKELFDELVKMIKNTYPYISIIQIGKGEVEKVKGVDVLLVDRSIEEIKWILKKSLLHIDCEGGLVHLATALGTKCAVLFGPTPCFFYGYKENINISSEECHWCMGTSDEWFTKCICNNGQKCLWSISPSRVLGKIKDQLNLI